MSLPVPNLESYNQQVGAIRAQLASLQQPSLTQPVQQMQFQAPAPLQVPSQIKYVDGIGGAKEYQSKMLPNSSEILMDKNEDSFYVASKDANGVSPKSMPIGHFTLEQEAIDEPTYMTKKDFENFEAKIISILKANNTQEADHEQSSRRNRELDSE